METLDVAAIVQCVSFDSPSFHNVLSPEIKATEVLPLIALCVAFIFQDNDIDETGGIQWNTLYYHSSDLRSVLPSVVRDSSLASSSSCRCLILCMKERKGRKTEREKSVEIVVRTYMPGWCLMYRDKRPNLNLGLAPDKPKKRVKSRSCLFIVFDRRESTRSYYVPTSIKRP